MSRPEVCKHWHQLSKEPSVWRVIEFDEDILVPKLKRKMGILTDKELLDECFREFTLSETPTKMKMFRPCYDKYIEADNNLERKVDKALHKMVKHAIDLSSEHLHDLRLQNFGSSQLRCLLLEDSYVYDSVQHDRRISHKGLIEMLRNFPLLEELQLELQLPNTRIFEEGIEIAGQCCPRLKTFILNEKSYSYTRNLECDKQALAIAKSMPGLHHLRLSGNRMTLTGLMAILNNCHHLEYLDLRQCYRLCKVLEEPELVTKLRQQIKHVRFPNDSTGNYEFDNEL